MGNILTECRQELFDAVPDGETIPWSELLKKAGNKRALLDALAFGKPDTVARNGNTFTCTGKIPASMALEGFKVFAENVVKFTLKPNGEDLVATDIVGISVEPPVILARFTMTHGTARLGTENDVYIKTAKFFVPITLVLTMDGKFKTCFLG